LASTSKSSSFHCLEGRFADACLGISGVLNIGLD
jgi:hypothetical protein